MQEKLSFQDAMKKYGTGAVIISMLLGGGLYLLEADQLYWCESRGLIQKFDRLSSTKITGYDSSGAGTRCTEGWKKVSDLQNITERVEPDVAPMPETMKCNEVTEYTPIYTVCWDDDGRKNYAGEVR